MIILTDASALISLFSKQDINHEKATKIIKNLKIAELLISNYIFAEVTTMLSQKEGKEKAVKVGEYLKNKYNWIRLDIETENLAWEIFKKQISKNVSFVDCTTFALYQKGVFDKAFTFDSDFKTNKIPILG